MSAFLLAAVGGTRGKAGLGSLVFARGLAKVLEFPYVALPADHLVAVVLGGEGLERRLNDTTTETEDQVEGGLLQASISVCSPRFLRSLFISHEPSGCCSRSECDHPRAACQQRSDAAGLGGCPPCPESCS